MVSSQITSPASSGRRLLEVSGSVGGNDICHRLHRIFGRDNLSAVEYTGNFAGSAGDHYLSHSKR